MKEPVLVTGAAGFIGMHVARRLLADGHNVVGLDNLNAYYDPRFKQARIAQLLAIREAGLGQPHDLSQITQPTFVANGDNDVMVASSQSHALAERIPNSKLEIYPDSGHGGIFQYHERFVPAVLGFLETDDPIGAA